jgi:hypothetical protein
MMPKVFESSFRKIEWAEGRVGDLYGEIQQFRQSIPYSQIVEPLADQPGYMVHKIKLTRDIPDSTLNLASDIVHNLRSSLDNAVYEISLASGNPNPRSAAFPFAGSIDEMANALGRCKDVPPVIHSLPCGFQPYQYGNDFLWALNKLSNTDKHKILRPFGTGVVRRLASMRGTGYFEMPDPHRWDSERNEMVIVTLGPETDFEYELNFDIFVAFGEVEGLRGQDVIGKLHNIGTTVYRTLRAMEAECRRLRFCQ